MTGPSMRPNNLDEQLVKLGFAKKDEATGMALAPLIQAREMGARFAVLQATEPGKGVFGSLGFTEYCTLGSYVLNI
jgi:hypothetical protein